MLTLGVRVVGHVADSLFELDRCKVATIGSLCLLDHGDLHSGGVPTPQRLQSDNGSQMGPEGRQIHSIILSTARRLICILTIVLCRMTRKRIRLGVDWVDEMQNVVGHSGLVNLQYSSRLRRLCFSARMCRQV